MVFYEDPSYRGIATREVVRVGTQAAQLSGTGGGGPGSYDNLIYPEKAVKFLAMRAQVDPGLGVVTQFEEPDGTRSELRYFGPRRVRIFDDQDLDPASVHADTPREVETDGHGQLVQVVETYRGGENNAALRTERTSYAWDALGNLVQLRRHGSASDGSGDIIKTQIYDTIGQKVQIDDFNAGTWTFGYDDAGNLAWHQDPRGNRFVFGYDDGNRLIWEDCVSGPTCGPEVEVRYHYDSPATWENGEGFFPAGIVDHDGIEIPQTHVLGRLAWVEDRGRRTYTSYNARGEVVAQAKNLHGFAMLPDANAPEVLTPMLVGDAELFYVSTRELDDVGRVRHETLVDGTELNYTYDRRGLLATLSGVYQDRALTFVQAVTYDLQGRRVAARLGGGIRETKTYNQMGRTLEVLRVLVDETETTTAEVLHLAYTYDRVGRLTSQTDLRADGLRLDGTSAPTVKTYTYDGQGQLLTSEERTVADDILVRRMRYDYDVLGNIVEKHTTRCMETTSPCTEQDDPPDEYYTHWFGTATYHGDQLVSADGGDGNMLVATYDLAGNMETLAVTRGGQPYFTHTYTWDEQNRLASAVGTAQLFHGGQGVVAVAGYAYDNGGARIAALRAKTFVGVELEETLYVDPSFEIRNGEYTTYVHDAKGRLARLISHGPAAPPDITWLHADHLGSTTVVTSDDGTFIEETKYLPYGAVQSTHRPDLGIPYEPYGFTGKEPERDFGILYFGARYYNPHLARWISPDPLFLHVTSESAEKDQNGYCYVSNDPVNRVDPDGHNTEKALIVGTKEQTEQWSKTLKADGVNVEVYNPGKNDNVIDEINRRLKDKNIFVLLAHGHSAILGGAFSFGNEKAIYKFADLHTNHNLNLFISDACFGVNISKSNTYFVLRRIYPQASLLGWQTSGPRASQQKLFLWKLWIKFKSLQEQFRKNLFYTSKIKEKLLNYAEDNERYWRSSYEDSFFMKYEINIKPRVINLYDNDKSELMQIDLLKRHQEYINSLMEHIR